MQLQLLLAMTQLNINMHYGLFIFSDKKSPKNQAYISMTNYFNLILYQLFSKWPKKVQTNVN